MPLQRFKMVVSYRGTHYHGWQRQITPKTWKKELPPPGHGIPTVQESLARALATVVRHPVVVVGSSRTDTGVHAKGQVAHFDTEAAHIPPEGMRRAANHRLPDDILIRLIEPAPPGFNAIASTYSKRYQYVIWNAPDREPLAADLSFHRWQALDAAAMAEAAKRFVGTHDFASFVRPGHKRETTVRTVYDVSVCSRPPRLIVGVEGAGFLWHMVRIMVGTLVEVGMGRYGADDITRMLAARDRRAAGPTAPPHGLYLQWIRYQPREADEGGPVS